MDPGRRHVDASVGPATSHDLPDWAYYGDALVPAGRGTWHDLALWTGSVVRSDDGVWRMSYTAISTRGNELTDQLVGVVESDDLFTWRRAQAGPVVRPDPRWYKTLDTDPGASGTWRDPFVFRDPDGAGWRMLICTRAVDAAPNDDGVLAEARSHDLLSWGLGPPVRAVAGRPVLVFTCHPDEQSDERRWTSGSYSTWSVVGDSFTGPRDVGAARPLVAEPRLFAAPLVQQRDGAWALVGFRNLESDGRHEREILDLVVVELRDGALQAVDGP